MSLDKKILNEINRYRSINKYIMEQEAEAPLDLGALAPEAGATPPPPPAEAGVTPPPPPAAPGGSTPIDVENDPDVEKIDDEGKSDEKKDGSSDSEELDITELVTAQKDTQTKQDEYFENLFGQLNGALFIDAGNIWNVLDNTENEDYIFNGLKSLENIAVGTGFGFRYDFNFFIVRLDLGFKTYNPALDENEKWFKEMRFNKSVLNIGINYPF
jgi:hypothetical protein